MKNIERRLSSLEAKDRPQVFDGPIWCNRERRAARILAIANGREWTCPDLTPEKVAWRDAKLARFEEYFASLERGEC